MSLAMEFAITGTLCLMTPTRIDLGREQSLEPHPGWVGFFVVGNIVTCTERMLPMRSKKFSEW